MSAPDDVWASFDHDPRQPACAGLRASDRDRDVVRTVLAAAYADGRLDREEFDERSELVGAARTLGDLPPAMTDLVPERALAGRSGSLVDAGPADLHRLAEAHWRSERRNAVVGFFGASLVCWAIWVATSWGDGSFEPYFPWPLIVMAASFANAVRAQVTREDAIRDEVRRLERKQAKQLRSRKSGE